MKTSFFERLTGGVKSDNIEDELNMEDNIEESSKINDWMDEDNDEGELAIDVHQTPDAIILKAMIAGVKPDDLEVDITRDMVTIKGTRHDEKEVVEDDYFYKELYWGSFSRTILLPQEIEPEEADAIEKHGLLIITLPKIDRAKSRKVKVKSN